MHLRALPAAVAGLATLAATGGAIAAAAVPATTPAGPPAPTSTPATTPSPTSTPVPSPTPLSTVASQPVVVLLKNQVSSLPAAPATLARRKTSVRQVQSPVLSDLAGSGARNVQSYTTVNAVSATVSPAEAADLASDPAVAEVVPDRPLKVPASAPLAGGTSAAAAGSCPSGDTVQLEPEALGLIHANSDVPGATTARSLGYTGAGVKVGFIADELDIDNAEFIRSNGDHVFVDYKDFGGDGTGVRTGGGEAFLDAGSIAAQGNTTYDVNAFVGGTLGGPCKIRIEGVAPGVSLVGLSIFGGENTGFNSTFLHAIEYATTVSHVDVLNESLGANNYPDDQGSQDIVKAANDAAVAAGITVTASSGDAGPTSTIGSPASDPNVIAVGATTSLRINGQIGVTNLFPGVTSWLSNNISSLSSSGYEQSGATIDLVAPGDSGWAPCSTDIATYADCRNITGGATPIEAVGGTSESAPLTAGVAALVIEAYAKTHGGTKPTPAIIKTILTSSADDIHAPAEQQAAGLLNAYRAVLLAQRYGSPSVSPTLTDIRNPAGFTTSVSQFNRTAQPGTPLTFRETITNSSARPEALSLSTRALGRYGSIKTDSFSLANAASSQITTANGTALNYHAITFTVPARVSRLRAQIGFLTGAPTVALIDPTGHLANESYLATPHGHGDAQVTDPAAGTWTAYVYGPADNGQAVYFDASIARYTTYATVTPSVIALFPGQSQQVTLNVTTPTTPGDSAGSLQIQQIFGGSSTSSVPITLRSLVPSTSTTFNDTLTGGVGRGDNIGQTNYYQVDVPAGAPALNASVKFAVNPYNTLSLLLIDPSGTAQAFGANELLTKYSNGSAYSENIYAAAAHVASPKPGRWTIEAVVAPYTSGIVSQPFSVHVDEDAPVVSAPGLPNSAATKLTAGQPTTVNVTVKNTGVASEAYFVDPRLSTMTTMSILPDEASLSYAPLRTDDYMKPAVSVPTNTTRIDASSTTDGTTPIQFDMSPLAGDPDIVSDVGAAVHASYTSYSVTPGAWSVLPTVVGAFGPAEPTDADGPPRSTVRTTVTATTKAFDRSITSPSGDMWLAYATAPASKDPSTLFNSVNVDPGQTITIPVTITPSGASGTVVSGTLDVDTSVSRVFTAGPVPAGSQVAALPYTYTIK